MVNPILERELKTRMRTWKTSILLTVFLLIIGGVLLLFFIGSAASSAFGAYGFDPSIISTIYDFLAMTLMILLMLIIPVFTASAISGERERQTLDLLLCTDFSPWKIIFGKMSAALFFVLLLIITAIPFIGITLLFGGISIIDIMKLVLFYMAASVMLSSIGMFTTTHFKRNITSIIMSYVIFAAMLAIPGFVMIGISIGDSYSRVRASNAIPFLEKYAYELILFLFGANPAFGVASLMNNDLFNMSYLVNNSTTFARHIEPWVVSIGYFALFSTVFILLSKRKLGKLK